MKSNKFERIPLLVVILALGILAVGAQSAGAQSSPPALPMASATLSARDYGGTFQFDMREMVINSTTNIGLSTNVSAIVIWMLAVP